MPPLHACHPTGLSLVKIYELISTKFGLDSFSPAVLALTIVTLKEKLCVKTIGQDADEMRYEYAEMPPESRVGTKIAEVLAEMLDADRCPTRHAPPPPSLITPLPSPLPSPVPFPLSSNLPSPLSSLTSPRLSPYLFYMLLAAPRALGHTPHSLPRLAC